MDTSIQLNGRTYIFVEGRIYSYRIAFWGTQVYRDVPPSGPLAQKLRKMVAEREKRT